MKKILIHLICLLILGGLRTYAQVPSTLTESLVFVEAFNGNGDLLRVTTGFFIKQGLIAANYHSLTGASKVLITKYGDKKSYVCEGYLSSDEITDWIVLSVPAIEGKVASAYPEKISSPQSVLKVIESPGLKKELKFGTAKMLTWRELNNREMVELTSADVQYCASGPVFFENQIAGIAIAGYFHENFHILLSPVDNLRSLLKKSMIIKPFNSLSDTFPLESSRMHEVLMDSIGRVLWVSFQDAVKRAPKFDRKLVIDVYTSWCGYCKLMEEKTYTDPDIYQYINDNFYAVKLDAESRETINFNGMGLTFDPMLKSHQLAYNLLEGNMSYPATVFLDEEINLLAVIPGYVSVEKMEVILNYFAKNEHLNHQVRFEDFQSTFISTK